MSKNNGSDESNRSGDNQSPWADWINSHGDIIGSLVVIGFVLSFVYHIFF